MADAKRTLVCPSARPEMPQSVVFGVVGGSPTEPRVRYLEKSLPVTDELLALTAPVEPQEVLRFAAPCAGGQCVHFDGARCSLALRTVQFVMPVVHRLPACSIRAECLWFAQEGRAACERCPQIVTEGYAASPEIVHAAQPPKTEIWQNDRAGVPSEISGGRL
jgi:hypothetical protein